jgi:hypothetical protein
MSKTVKERMESVEAQGQVMARQMAQIANLLENALRIQPGPTPIPNNSRYTFSAPGTLVPTEDQPPSTPTPVSVQAAPSARVTDRSYSATTSVASSLPPTPQHNPQISVTAPTLMLEDALFRTTDRPSMDTLLENSETPDDDDRHLTVTTPEAQPLEISPSLEDQYVAVNYTSTRFPGWEHGSTRPVQIHTLDDPFHRSSRERFLGIPADPKADVQASLSGHPHLGTNDNQWENRDFMPGGPPNSAMATPSFLDRFRPPGRATHQVTNIRWPSIGATSRNAIIVAGPDGRQSSIAYYVYVEGFPHPYSRQLFYKRDRATKRSKSHYYAVLYSHEVGIYYTWPGCWVRTCDYPGAKYVSTNSYAEALYQLWLSDAYRLPTVERRIQPENGNYTPPSISDPTLRPPRYPHPYKLRSWRSSAALDTMAELFQMAQVAHIRPDAIPSSMVIPSPAGSLAGPPHVVRVTNPGHTSRSGSTPSSDGQTTLSLSTAGSQSHLSTDEVLAKMRAQMAVDRHQQATDCRDETYRKYRMEKLPAFHDLEEWDIWWRKTRNMLGHEAWGDILVKPWETTPTNDSLSRELYMRLTTALNKTTGVILNGRDDLDGQGLEILHLLHHEYSPTDTLTLPTVFTEWSTLHQHKTESASAFAGRVLTLAQQSRRCGQTYTEPSIILTFLCGLNSNFEAFVRDYHTGHNDVTTAKLANVVQIASSLEKTHNGKQGTLAWPASRPAGGPQLLAELPAATLDTARSKR